MANEKGGSGMEKDSTKTDLYSHIDEHYLDYITVPG